MEAPLGIYPVGNSLQASEFRELSEPEILTKIGSLKNEIASVRFLQRTRGISEVKPGEQQNPDPEKVCWRTCILQNLWYHMHMLHGRAWHRHSAGSMFMSGQNGGRDLLFMHGPMPWSLCQLSTLMSKKGYGALRSV